MASSRPDHERHESEKDMPITGRRAADGATAGTAKDWPGGQQPKAAGWDVAGALVCVVDDDAAVRDSFRTLLESLGFAVMTHASGRDMLLDARRHRANCFIVDQHMPEMDGLATLGALRRDGSGGLTILVTGRLDAEIAARAAALGGVAILEKPFSATRLLALLRTGGRPVP